MPFPNASQEIPNKNSTLSYKFAYVPSGMHCFARWRDDLNYKMHFIGKPFGIASFSSRRLARCGGLKEETFIRNPLA
jgi:hypothetical protein